MKGYYVESGYMGYVDGRYILFADETDYMDYMEGQKRGNGNQELHFNSKWYTIYGGLMER